MDQPNRKRPIEGNLQAQLFAVSKMRDSLRLRRRRSTFEILISRIDGLNSCHKMLRASSGGDCRTIRLGISRK